MKSTTDKKTTGLLAVRKRIVASAQYFLSVIRPVYVLCGVTMVASILVGICIRRTADCLSRKR